MPTDEETFEARANDDFFDVQADSDVYNTDEDEDPELDRQQQQLREQHAGHDNDCESDADVEYAHDPSTPHEKRRAQNELFKLYAARKTEQVTEREVKEAIRNANDDCLSIRDILAKQETSNKITQARDYQTELFRRATEQNIIAVLDTGSGKTHIATLLLRHVLDMELDSRAKGNAPKIAFFLVDSVNLVFQQANVLRCGLDQNVEGICGAMGAALWQNATWEKLFTNNMVIVCTAEVLVQSMMHSFITMSGVSLLIFDEAHHAKNNHPYARLIKEYYLTEPDLSARPRIFGMTASPVDSKTDVRQAARDLEVLLHSKIATASDLSLLANHINRPSEEVATYPKLRSNFETSFHCALKQKFGDIRAFHRLFQTSRILGSELGRWASDMYWSFAFTEEEGRKMEMREERKFHKHKGNESIKKLDAEIARLREAAEFVRGHEFGLPTPTPADLSSKVLLLHGWLQLYYERTADARCIIFVERRATARLLKMIFSHIGGPNLHSGLLVGSNSVIGDTNISLRTQIITIAKFREGELNCLFATAVAEEGLDIPQCNLVVRFDLYKTMISYVQSRGRARHRNSKYLHMVEAHNVAHQATVFDARNAEQIMRDFCNALPSDRLLDDDDDPTKFLAKEKSYRSYTDPDSGAKLTYRSSLSVLAHFTASIPAPNQEIILQPHYVIDNQVGRFLCEVILPPCAPIISMRGLPYTKKTEAKCSAAFEMCLELRRRNFLDANLLPTYQKNLPAMRNAQLAISSKKKDLYAMRIKPEFWKLGQDTVPDYLYLTVLDVTAGLDRSYQPVGLLTRAYFPEMPKFPIYLNDGHPTEVLSTPIMTAIPVSEEVLNKFTKVTLQVFHHIFAKKYEKNIGKMSYWLVPLKPDEVLSISTSFGKPENLIDWDQVQEVSRIDRYDWTPEMPTEFLANKYIVDELDGGRRFFSVGVAPHLKARDPVPVIAPRHKFMTDILEYSNSMWKGARAKKRWNESQPVVEVQKIPFRRNLLALVEHDEDEIKMKMTTYICPEPLVISSLSPEFVTMCYVFPAVIHRFDSYLIALDACRLLDLNIGPRLALEALTKDSENSDEHGEEKVNFKSGMGPNYERLEFLGDCFLKMATTIATFVQQPDENEFEFHVRRMLMLCNKNLFRHALERKLYEYVRTMAFSRRTWYPEHMKLLWGKGHKRAGPQIIQHSLGDKSVADVCEAFIGAAFLEHNVVGHYDPGNWDQAVKAVMVMVNCEDHPMEKWSDYYASYEKPRYQLVEATASQLDMAKKIEQKHPYHFKYPRLLRSAFMHPSQQFMIEEVPNYQRLEFLGDALLDQVYIEHLFYHYPNKDPQWLTEHKMPMVSNKFLGAICVKLGLHTHIRQNNAMLTTQIMNYVAEVQEAEREANGTLDYWVNVVDPPKCLADVIEAFVGAMFVDSEFNFTVVQDFFDMHLKRFFHDISLYDSFALKHPYNRLHRLLTDTFGCHEWRLACRNCESIIPGAKATVVAMIQIHMDIPFDGTSVSARYAKINASNNALEKLEGLPRYEFRRLYHCDCVDEEMDEEDMKKLREAMGAVEL